MTDHPIRTARKAQGMSVAALAEAAGVSVPTIYSIETGRSQGRVTTLVSLAKVLGLPVTDVVTIWPPSEEPAEFGTYGRT